MPFLRAGFNARNVVLDIFGWTRPHGTNRSHFAPAELRRFDCGDYFWLGLRKPQFLAWGEQCVFGSWGFDLPWEYQNGLAHCDLDTREQVPAWKWAEERRAALEAAA